MTQNGNKPVRAIIYARCSTDEARQDCESQINELRRYAEAMGWEYDVEQEYDSAYRGKQEQLQRVLEQIRHGQYQVFIVWDLSRFSRQHPSKVNALLDTIVHRDACRFVSKQEGIDSDNELVWNCIKPLFSYFAFTFSRQLSERIKIGIRTKKEKGQYKGGRPAKQIDAERLKTIWRMYPQLGWRLKTARFNEGLDSKHQVSVSLLRKVCKKLSFGSDNGHEAHVHEGA